MRWTFGFFSHAEGRAIISVFNKYLFAPKNISKLWPYHTRVTWLVDQIRVTCIHVKWWLIHQCDITFSHFDYFFFEVFVWFICLTPMTRWCNTGCVHTCEIMTHKCGETQSHIISHVCTRPIFIYIYVYICTHTCIYVHICIYIYMYICICIYIYKYVYVYIHIYIHTNLYICICVYINVRINIPIYVQT